MYLATLARGPSLRRVVLSTPILATIPPPTSARRSTTSRAALIGFTATGAPDGGTRRACDAGVETDLSCSTMGCVIVPLPHTPTGLWCCPSKIFIPFVAFARVNGARHPYVSRHGGVVSRRGYRIPCVRTDHLLAAHGDFVMALRQSDLSFRRPPATGPLGRYPGRTLTGKSIAASQDTLHTDYRRPYRTYRDAFNAARALFFSSFQLPGVLNNARWRPRLPGHGMRTCAIGLAFAV
jgi:hypothetical protein